MVTREFFALNILRTNMIVAIHKNVVTHHHQVYISDMMIVIHVFLYECSDLYLCQ